MKLVCSNGHAVKWKHKKCRRCGEALGAFAFLRRKWRRLSNGPLIYCPKCSLAFPVRYRECPFCENPNTVDGLMQAVRKTTLNKSGKAKPAARRKFQRFYFILSAIALFAAFGLVSSLDADAWTRIGAVSVIYLGSLALLLKWFVRTEIVIKFLMLTNWVVKLALIFNYLSCLMVLQVAVQTWWERFMALAALVAITYCGACVYSWFFWPMVSNVKSIFLGSDASNAFDSMGDQGRQGRWDGEKWEGE